MRPTIYVIQFGLGPIGCATARLITQRDGYELIGAVDIDPDKIGQDTGRVIGLDRSIGVDVVASIDAVARLADADAVVHTTSSYFPLFKDQVADLLRAGLDVVSTAEELSFPWLANADEAGAIDTIAREAGKTIAGTGVNPGFLMDSLPLFLTSLSQTVDHISVRRVINASCRRGPFQAKIGSGLTPEAFMEKMEAGRMGHVGLPESMGMLFDTLGKRLEKYDSTVEPVVAVRRVETDHFTVEPGMVRGLLQTATGHTVDGEFVRLTFEAALDAEEDGDTINIHGTPDLEVSLRGTNGDLATVAIAVNAVRTVVNAAPGLATMRDLPLVTWS